MQMSRRALRMERHHRRQKRGAGINLVSMMDVFTILVFFLLVNSGEVDVLPNPREITLPESIAEERARESVVVVVTDEQIVVQGRAVATVAEVLASEAMVIPALRDALRDQTTGRMLIQQVTPDGPLREVTILGDREIPYSLLKRVMATCTAADFGQISLAVAQKGAAAPGPTPMAAL